MAAHRAIIGDVIYAAVICNVYAYLKLNKPFFGKDIIVTDDSQIEALERLTRLRDSGSLSEDEFAKEKAKVLAAKAGPTPPFYRQLWLVVVFTCLLITFPVALLILLTGDVYRRKEGVLVPIGKGARFAYAGFLALWAAALVTQAVLHPQSLKDEIAANAVSGGQTQTASDGPKAPDACDSSGMANTVKSVIENGALSGIIHVKVVDLGHLKELYFSKRTNTRYCQADAELNTGSTAISYRVYFGPSGGELVETHEGEDAWATNQMSAAEAIEAKQQDQAQQAVVAPQAAQPAQNQQQATAGSDATCNSLQIDEQEPYAQAFKEVAAAGFSTWIDPKHPEPSTCSSLAKDCSDHPEIHTCTSDGFCLARLIDGKGSTIEMSLSVGTSAGEGVSIDGSTVTEVNKVCK
jgi:hypothetical protein